MDRERRRERDREEEPSGDGAKPSPLLIIAAVAVVVVIIGVVVFVFSGNQGVSSIAVGNISKDVNGISFPIYTTVNGLGEYDGEVDIEIFHDGLDEPVYTGKASIREDSGSHEVEYTEFVWGNGDYRVRASSGGVSDFITFRIDSVADEILPEWEGKNADPAELEALYVVDVTIGYMFGIDTSPDPDDPQRYSFLGTVTTPDGRLITIDSADFPANLLKITRSIEHLAKGTYVLQGEVTNLFCHPDSPYRTVMVDEDNTFAYDAPPFADAREDTTVSLTDGEALVEFDASASWDDSEIMEYIWYVGDDVVSSTSPTITYTFTETGTYYVSLDVVDDEGNHSRQNAGASTFSVIVE